MLNLSSFCGSLPALQEVFASLGSFDSCYLLTVAAWKQHVKKLKIMPGKGMYTILQL